MCLYLPPNPNPVSKKLIIESAILGAALIAINFVMYLIDMKLMFNTFLAIFLGLGSLGGAIWLAFRERGRQGGYMRYWDAWKTFVTIAVVVILMNNAYQIMMFKVVDPQMVEVYAEYTMETTVSMMETFGAPESEIEKTLTELENQDWDEQYSIGKMMLGLVIGIAMYAVFSFLWALIVRKDPPMVTEALDGDL